MAALRGLAIAAALLSATPAHADMVTRWRPYIIEASARFGVPVAWIERVIRAESGGMTVLSGRPITSRAGAMGLMQLMPGTWSDMRAVYGLGTDPHDPRDNIMAGTAYLRLMYDRFGYPGLFAAYNAGPARYADHLATGRNLPGETVAYLASITDSNARRDVQVVEPPVNGIFFALGSAPPTSPDGSRGAGDQSLFVRLGAYADNQHRSEGSRKRRTNLCRRIRCLPTC